MKGSMTMSMLAGLGIIVFIIIVAFLMYKVVSGGQDATVELECRKICKSHDYTYQKSDAKLFGEGVCYCLDNDNSIFTFIT